MRLSRILTGILVCFSLMHPAASVTVKSLYGEVTIDQPIFVELLENPVFQRLKKIDVSGPSRYFRNLPGYSMFDHALGVYVLLKKFNLPLKEQLAGVLQYTSHSVFGDFGSFLFDTEGLDIFNVDTEEDFFKKTNLDKILQKYSFSPRDLYPFQKEFKAISALPPDLSAGEIEENIRLAFSYNLITRESITKIVNDLRFDKGIWYFVDQDSAHKLAMISLYFCEKLWGAGITFAINRWFGSAIKRANEIHSIDLTIIRFGTDETVLKNLFATKDPLVMGFLYKARQPYRFFRVVEDAQESFDYLYKPKFEGLDPYVKVGENFKRLSEIDSKFKEEFERVKAEFNQGIRIKYRDKDYPVETDDQKENNKIK